MTPFTLVVLRAGATDSTQHQAWRTSSSFERLAECSIRGQLVAQLPERFAVVPSPTKELGTKCPTAEVAAPFNLTV
jgi:hypothetical protein